MICNSACIFFPETPHGGHLRTSYSRKLGKRVVAGCGSPEPGRSQVPRRSEIPAQHGKETINIPSYFLPHPLLSCGASLSKDVPWCNLQRVLGAQQSRHQIWAEREAENVRHSQLTDVCLFFLTRSSAFGSMTILSLSSRVYSDSHRRQQQVPCSQRLSPSSLSPWIAVTVPWQTGFLDKRTHCSSTQHQDFAHGVLQGGLEIWGWRDSGEICSRPLLPHPNLRLGKKKGLHPSNSFSPWSLLGKV